MKELENAEILFLWNFLLAIVWGMLVMRTKFKEDNKLEDFIRVANQNSHSLVNLLEKQVILLAQEFQMRFFGMCKQFEEGRLIRF